MSQESRVVPNLGKRNQIPKAEECCFGIVTPYRNTIIPGFGRPFVRRALESPPRGWALKKRCWKQMWWSARAWAELDRNKPGHPRIFKNHSSSYEIKQHDDVIAYLVLGENLWQQLRNEVGLDISTVVFLGGINHPQMMSLLFWPQFFLTQKTTPSSTARGRPISRIAQPTAKGQEGKKDRTTGDQHPLDQDHQTRWRAWDAGLDMASFIVFHSVSRIIGPTYYHIVDIYWYSLYFQVSHIIFPRFYNIYFGGFACFCQKFPVQGTLASVWSLDFEKTQVTRKNGAETWRNYEKVYHLHNIMSYHFIVCHTHTYIII